MPDPTSRSRRRWLDYSLSAIFIACLWPVATLFTWLTPFVLIRSDVHSSFTRDGSVGEPSTTFHSGLPWRYLTRSDIGMNMDINEQVLQADIIFWFCTFVVSFLACRFLMARRNLKRRSTQLSPAIQIPNST